MCFDVAHINFIQWKLSLKGIHVLLLIFMGTVVFCNLSHFRPFVEARAAHHGVGMYEEIGE